MLFYEDMNEKMDIEQKREKKLRRSLRSTQRYCFFSFASSGGMVILLFLGGLFTPGQRPNGVSIENWSFFLIVVVIQLLILVLIGIWFYYRYFTDYRLDNSQSKRKIRPYSPALTKRLFYPGFITFFIVVSFYILFRDEISNNIAFLTYNSPIGSIIFSTLLISSFMTMLSISYYCILRAPGKLQESLRRKENVKKHQEIKE